MPYPIPLPIAELLARGPVPEDDHKIKRPSDVKPVLPQDDGFLRWMLAGAASSPGPNWDFHQDRPRQRVQSQMSEMRLIGQPGWKWEL
jgi:hypothetical protein